MHCPLADSPLCSDPKVMATPQGIVLGVLAGKPEALSWDLKLDRLEREMEAAREGMQFSEKEAKHRRGVYLAAHSGISYGGGSKVRSNSPLKQTGPR